jgi:hypothetical protein
MSKKKKETKKKKNNSKNKPEQEKTQLKDSEGENRFNFMDEDYKKEVDSVLAELQAEAKSKESKGEMGDYTFNEKQDESHISEEQTSLEYNKLTDEEERRKIKSNMAKAHAFLKTMGIEDLEIDAKKNIIIVPFEYEDLQFLSHIIVGSEWFIVKASILELEALPKPLAAQIFFELLKSNFILNNVVYSIDPEAKSIWTEADIPSDLDFEHFKLQYLSIVFAIDFFIKNIAKQLMPSGKVQSTFSRPAKDDNQLYV